MGRFRHKGPRLQIFKCKSFAVLQGGKRSVGQFFFKQTVLKTYYWGAGYKTSLFFEVPKWLFIKAKTLWRFCARSYNQPPL